MAEEPRDTSRDRATPLLFEHERLGARFGSFGDAVVALDYGIPVDEPLPLDHPLIADLSFQSVIRVAGTGSHGYLSALLTGDIAAMDHIGATGWSLVLDGEGRVFDVVLAMRTGDDEYLLMADAPAGRTVFGWMDALRRLRLDGKVGSGDEPAAELLFGDVEVADQSGQLGAICLMGPDTAPMLDELCGGRASASEGLVAGRGLCFSDDIPAMPFMAVRDGSLEQSLVVFASRIATVALWQALLGFPELQVVGLDQYESIRRARGLWLDGIGDGARPTPVQAGIEGLLRPGGGYVGYRGARSGA